MTTFFTADLHFGHERIIEFHPDRGATLGEMHDRLIDGWNSVVQSGDDVWVLGDFAMGRLDDSLKFFHRLKGSKHLIRGNHDGNRTVKELSWASVHDIREWRQKPHKAVLCHYPMLTWNGAHHGVWMLHGHSHGMLAPHDTTRMDVGVDTHPHFRPYSLHEVFEHMSTRQYRPVDAHRPPMTDDYLQARGAVDRDAYLERLRDDPFEVPIDGVDISEAIDHALATEHFTTRGTP